MNKKLGMLLVGSFAVTLAGAAFTACDSSAEYTVTFISDGVTIAEVAAEEGKTVYSAYVPTADGVRFDGWFESETASSPFDFATAITGDLTLYARFSSLTYSVTYDLGGASGTAPVQAGVNADGSFTVSEAVPERTGYQFAGWTDGSSVYAAGDTYTVGGDNEIVLVAIWNYRDVKVTFLNDADKVVYSETIPYGSSVIAPETVAHSSFAFGFVGWSGGTLYNVTEDTTYRAVYEYAPADESYFSFTLNADKAGYTVAAKNASKLPEKLALPDEYKGLPVTAVATDGFAEAYNTTAVYIPSSYRVLGGEAFYRAALEEVYIEEGLEIIGACAFQSLNGIIKTFEIPASLKEIHTAAFQGLLPTDDYDYLEPNEQQAIDSFKFTVADGANFVYNDDETLLLSADGKELLFVSPSVVNLVVPATVEVIAPALCMHYHKLKTVHIEGALKEISGGAFKGCYSLNKLTFADGAYVEKISGADGGEQYVDGVVVPSSAGAFHDCDLQGLVFPAGLKYIGAAAFYWNPRIDTVVLPTTVEHISEQAFENSQYDLSNTTTVGKENLTTGGISSITFAGGATQNDYYKIDGRSIIEIGTGVNDGDKFLYYCSAAAGSSYIVPSGVTSASPFCFSQAEFLRTLELPEGLTELPYGFAMLSKIESVNIPASVQSFSDTLTSVDGTEEGTWGTVWMWGAYGTFISCSNLKTITFAPNGLLRTLPSNSLNGIGAETITIPAYITEIESFAIYGENLKEINVEEGNTYYKSVDGVLFTADGTVLLSYPAGKTATEYTVPSGTVEIAQAAFNVCKNLVKVIVSEGVTTIESYAFNYCYDAGWEETEDGDWVLNPDNIKGLKTVELPSTLEYIGDNAFSYCMLLESVTFTGSSVPTLDNSFGEYGMFGTIDWNTGEPALFENLKFTVPEQYFVDYYMAFYEYCANYIVGFTVPESLIVTYSFETFGGSEVETVQGYMLTELTVPEKEGYYFWGWYLQDGSESGDWGDMLSLPYIADTADRNVTIYARWETTRKQDGTADIWAYELSAEPVTFTTELYQATFFTLTPTVDCYFLLDGIPEGYYYMYYVYDEYGESAGYNGYFELQAGVTYYVYYICNGDENDGEGPWEYELLPAFYDENGEPLEIEDVLPSEGD